MSTNEQVRGLAADEAGNVRTLPGARRAVLRCKPDSRAKVSAAIGLDLPSAACTANRRTALAALWLGPDEWLLLADESDHWAQSLLRNLNGISCSAVEVSDRQVAYAVESDRAETILASGCPLDLDISAFPVGMCTRTVFHKAQVVLWRTAPDRFHLEVWRSFSGYVEAMLRLADAEE